MCSCDFAKTINRYHDHLVKERAYYEEVRQGFENNRNALPLVDSFERNHCTTMMTYYRARVEAIDLIIQDIKEDFFEGYIEEPEQEEEHADAP